MPERQRPRTDRTKDPSWLDHTPNIGTLQVYPPHFVGAPSIVAGNLANCSTLPNPDMLYTRQLPRSRQIRPDIDLMVIGDLSPVELAAPLRHARELLGREINPTVYSPAEFSKKRGAKDHFLTKILTKPRLLVLGSENELDKTARK